MALAIVLLPFILALVAVLLITAAYFFYRLRNTIKGITQQTATVSQQQEPSESTTKPGDLDPNLEIKMPHQNRSSK